MKLFYLIFIRPSKTFVSDIDKEIPNLGIVILGGTKIQGDSEMS